MKPPGRFWAGVSTPTVQVSSEGSSMIETTLEGIGRAEDHRSLLQNCRDSGWIRKGCTKHARIHRSSVKKALSSRLPTAFSHEETRRLPWPQTSYCLPLPDFSTHMLIVATGGERTSQSGSVRGSRRAVVLSQSAGLASTPPGSGTDFVATHPSSMVWLLQALLASPWT